MTDQQSEIKRNLSRRWLKTTRACEIHECLQDIYADSVGRVDSEAGFRSLRSWMMYSRLKLMKVLARQLRRHWRDILAYFDHPYTNVILEGLNSLIQNVKTPCP